MYDRSFKWRDGSQMLNFSPSSPLSFGRAMLQGNSLDLPCGSRMNRGYLGLSNAGLTLN
jgi:hypothetical protein